jgi:hypothetical protein
MSDSNSVTYIYTDGSVTTFDRHGVKIKDLSGDLPILHRIIEIVRMPAKNKAKLANDIKLYNTTFWIVRTDTNESILVPVQHIISFIKSIDRNDVEDFITNLLLQIPK